ncbi:MAG TPA: AAA family ATPase [Archangium sp.]|uniref:AAA family ATPase n=1 Tax=Archangium sp. TaxID=1872627 RepID=UPI002E345B01|nr:AAA family ATPase [Archangium sp.]HEX5747590.1 AAA family ATPase [Archangium sp.]
MTLSAIHVRNYRSFAEPQSLELRPLTLLYGDNSAGKSALVRLLPLLADSVSMEDGGPLNLASAAARGSTYEGLRWKGSTSDDAPPEMVFTFEWKGGAGDTRIEMALDWERSWKRLIVKRFSLLQGDQTLLSGEWRFRAQEQGAVALTYAINAAGVLSEKPVLFRGLVPESEGIPAPLSLILREGLLGLRRSVLWLGSRQLSARSFPRPTAPAWTMRPDGGDLGALLASHPEVLREVSAWCEAHLQRAVEIIDVPELGHFRVTLRHTARATLDVDLLDAGEGVVKVMPVLAALALSRRPAPTAPRILAIEEPESHLHPRLQRALAAHIASAVSGSEEPPSVLLETHSQHILLGVQIQVARGLLRPEQVQVYWVHQDESGRSRAEPIRLSEEGRLQGNWPSTVYTEINDMAGELIRARQERLRK